MAKVAVSIRIDLTKVDMNRVFTGKNGNQYMDATAFVDLEAYDGYGNSGMITQSVSREEKQQGIKGNILGNVRYFWSDSFPVPQQQQQGQQQGYQQQGYQQQQGQQQYQQQGQQQYQQQGQQQQYQQQQGGQQWQQQGQQQQGQQYGQQGNHGGQQQNWQQPQNQHPQQGQPQYNNPPADFDDDIPF